MVPAWKNCFYVKNAPQQDRGVSMEIPRFQPGLDSKPFEENKTKPKFKRFPKWALKSFDLLDKNTLYKNALAAHHQGLMMQSEHPSFALAAFATSIEVVGHLLIGEKCQHCGKKNGSNQKFRAALQAVIPDADEVSRLSKLYETRSETVHEGILHGDEQVPGSLPDISFFTRDPDFLFAHMDLGKLRDANQKLLEKLLKGQLKLAPTS